MKFRKDCFLSPWLRPWPRIFLESLASKVVFVCLACSITLPNLANGGVISGNTGGPYFDGHMISYTCSNNFATTAGPISCTCDGTTDPDNAAWSCSPVFTIPLCRRS